MTDEDFRTAFEAGTLDPAVFDHRAHLRMGWIYVTAHPLGEAITRFSHALRHFTQVVGAEAKYHETITVFFLLLIGEKQAHGQFTAFDEFLEANPDLTATEPSVLSVYYRGETLASEHARRHYVLPDQLTAA